MKRTVLSTFIIAVLLASGGNKAGAQLVLGQSRKADWPIESDYTDWSFSLTRDRLTLVVASDRFGMGEKNYDILLTTRTSISEPFGREVDLGPSVNSSVKEYIPRITADGLTLFFVADKEREGGLGDQDIWLTTRTSISETFGPAVNMGAPVNGAAQDVPMHITEDGLTFYFSSDRAESMDIYVTTRTSPSAPFGPPVALGAAINTSTGYESGPALTPDGRTLVFMANWGGEVDLYMATRESAYGPFGTPIRLPVSISGFWEFNPYISPDGSTLYYLSDIAGSYENYEAPILRGGHPFRDMTTDFYETVLGRAPEAGAVDAWQHGYYYYTEDWRVDVRFVMREMARLFFLSDEYTNRARTDAEFITDCYEAFLLRTPWPDESDAWLGDIDPGTSEVRWNRAEVMTQFAECAEFADMIVGQIPNQEGDATRNFVTRMYIGSLDRFVDSDGLIDWTDSLTTATDKRQVAKEMASELFLSEEGQSITPDNETLVARLYRAFLGRFPADNEVEYWAAELDAERETLESLIERFGDSMEFTALLQRHFGGPVETVPGPVGTFTMG